MKRVTITFPDELEQKLNAYLLSQRTPPSLSKVVQTALEEWLEQQKWAAYELEPAREPFRITVAELPVSDAEAEPDVSANHDA